MIFALGQATKTAAKPRCSMPSPAPTSMVGNFPGVTVDQKTGDIRGEKNCSVVDLPGIYSLRPYTQEEIVSRVLF